MGNLAKALPSRTLVELNTPFDLSCPILEPYVLINSEAKYRICVSPESVEI